MKKICFHIATLGPIGYFLAPGTVASILALPCVSILKKCAQSDLIYAGIVILIFMLSLLIVELGHRFLHIYHDPSEIVLDEVVGCLFAFLWIPFTVESAVMGLILFRFFDISKRFGISHIERLPGAIGIMLDDVAAGLFTALILKVITSF